MVRQLGWLVLGLLAGCGPSVSGFGPEDELGGLGQPLVSVPCRITMDLNGSKSVIDLESDGSVPFDQDTSYVLNVVKCEHGGAPFEALKAQAVMARSLVVYRYHRYGVTTFGSGTSFQVYSCGRATTAKEKADIQRAVRETRGQILSWKGFVVWTSYIAGTQVTLGPDAPGLEDDIRDCRAAGGTVNWDKSGCDITWGSGLPPTNRADCEKWPYVYNRGLAVQHGQSCLDRRGWKYGDILRFYFGADSYLRTVASQCDGPAPGPEDAFCAARTTSGWYCLDASRRVYCRSGNAEGIERCGERCEERASSEPDVCIGGSLPYTPGEDGGTSSPPADAGAPDAGESLGADGGGLPAGEEPQAPAAPSAAGAVLGCSASPAAVPWLAALLLAIAPRPTRRRRAQLHR